MHGKSVTGSSGKGVNMAGKGAFLVIKWQNGECNNGRKIMLYNIYLLTTVNKKGVFYVLWHSFDAYFRESPYLCSAKEKERPSVANINQTNKG